MITLIVRSKFSRLFSRVAIVPNTCFYSRVTGFHHKISDPHNTQIKSLGVFLRQFAVSSDSKPVRFSKIKSKKMAGKGSSEEGDVLSVMDKTKLEDLIKQRFIYDQAFAIYGGVAGLYDMGPLGSSMLVNMITAWRNFFIIREQMYEIMTSALTPEPVLKASGHVARFLDYMVTDVKTGDCFRADHLIKDHLEKLQNNKATSEEMKSEIKSILPKIDGFSKQDMADIIKKFDMKSPKTNNDLLEPHDFNLMFDTSIGPTGLTKAYLRPETAQGMFVNFKRLLDCNQGKLPFAAAQVGLAFRNEISPRNGLIRVREFLMAEIEHFCDPQDKSHKKFKTVEDVEMNFYSACNQVDGKPPQKMTIGKAVETGLVDNQTLGYFLARVFLFLKKMGVKEDKLRFRQHMSNEMAHYARDCWDAECKTTHGWVECVGNADRSCYDLTQHTKATGVKLVAEKRLPEPVEKQVVEIVINKGLVGKKFKQTAKAIISEFSSFDDDQIKALEQHFAHEKVYLLKVDGEEFAIEKDMVEVKKSMEKCHTEEFVPSVIEPSFGIGRIIYVILEHNFHTRENDEQRTYLSLPPIIAPYKCSVLPLSANEAFTPFLDQLVEQLADLNVSHRLDTGGVAIGRRYARTDQIGIPFGITVDFDTVNKLPHTATLRERDSMKQIRAEVSEIPQLVRQLCDGKITWSEVMAKYPVFQQQETV